jgi:hypothetical protein
LRQAEQSKKSRIWQYDSVNRHLDDVHQGEHQGPPTLKGLAKVVTLLGTGRTHDARRTFVSLSLADGSRRDILRWITHGPEGDVVSAYTTLPWASLCGEVAKLRIELREGRLLEFRKLASGACDSPCDSPSVETKKPRIHADLWPSQQCPRRDSKTWSRVRKTKPRRDLTAHPIEMIQSPVPPLSASFRGVPLKRAVLRQPDGNGNGCFGRVK